MVVSIKITLKKGLAGESRSRRTVIESLGLGKINSSTIQPENDATNGKIVKVRDLVDVESIED